MNRWFPALLVLPVLAALALPAAHAEERPFAALPYTPSLDPSVMDRSADPCVDFYRFSCGKWLEKNPIPADRSSWSVYAKTSEENQRFLWGMLEEAGRPSPGRDANTQKIGDYFASCMEEAAVEKAGADPIQPGLAAIAGLKSRADLPALLARLHLQGGAGDVLFGFGSGQDPRDASRVLAVATAGGLGLPEPEYYLKDDEKSKETRERYQAHVRKIFELLGDSGPVKNAQAVLRIETALAKASLTPAEQRDPYKVTHPMKRKELQALTPGFPWDAYLKALSLPDQEDFNVTEPAFFQALDKEIAAASLDDLRAYLRFHQANGAAPYLSASFVRASFDFYDAYLQGAQEMSPRWKLCVTWIDRDLGEALGEVFVSKVFPPQVKAGTQKMVQQIKDAMEVRIRELPLDG